MKKIMLIGMIVAGGVIANAGDVTLEQYLQSKKQNDERKGKTFNEAKYRKAFADQDANKDGVLTDQEVKEAQAAKKDGK